MTGYAVKLALAKNRTAMAIKAHMETQEDFMQQYRMWTPKNKIDASAFTPNVLATARTRLIVSL